MTGLNPVNRCGAVLDVRSRDMLQSDPLSRDIISNPNAGVTLFSHDAFFLQSAKSSNCLLAKLKREEIEPARIGSVGDDNEQR